MCYNFENKSGLSVHTIFLSLINKLLHVSKEKVTNIKVNKKKFKFLLHILREIPDSRPK